MKKSTRYRTRNWSKYNRALKQRGSLTVWGSKDALAKVLPDLLQDMPGQKELLLKSAILNQMTVWETNFACFSP